MDEEFYTAHVDPSVADLIPEYMENRRKELALLKEHLANQDFGKLSEIAHRMVGVGTPYGFNHITDLARVIRETAAANDASTVAELLKEYEHYIHNVKVKIQQL